MKIESQVCSLEQANRLYELGIKGPSEFYYRDNRKPETLRHVTQGFYGVSAFTVAELGVMLPPNFCTKINTAGHCICFDQWMDKNANKKFGDTEAQARAAMLIHLLESNLVTAEDCNKRLNY